MDYRQTLSIGFVIISAAVLVKSLNTATAFSGPSVSFANNPVLSKGGNISAGTALVMTAPSDQRIVITDLLLSMNSSSCASTVELTNDSGTTLAAVKNYSDRVNVSGSGNARAAYSPASQTQHAFKSGLPIDPDDSIHISEDGNCSIAYTLSGYYAQP